MAYDRSLHASMREEVQALRKKVVALETAEADNEKLRKELSKLRVISLEQKAQLELDFMNQLTGVARENALRLEEMEGRLAESTNVNRLLSEKLQYTPTPESVEKQIQEIEAQHRKDLASTIDANKAEIERTRQQLVKLMESRDQLVEQCDEAKESLAQKEKEIEILQTKEAANDGSNKRQLQDIRLELADLQVSRDQLAKDLDETKANLQSKDAEIDALRLQMKTNEETSKAQLDNTLKELTSLKISREQLAVELEKAKLSLKAKETEIDSLMNTHSNFDDANRTQLDKVQQQVTTLEMTRIELSQQLEEAKADLLLKQKDFETIHSSKLFNEDCMRKQLADADDETTQLKSKINSLEADMEKQSSSSESATNLLKSSLRSCEEELDAKNAVICRLEAQIGELSGKSTLDTVLAKSMDQEKSKLKETIHKLETEKVEQKLFVARLEREKVELTKKFETEVKILKQHLKARDEEFSETGNEILRLESQTSGLSGKLVSSEHRVSTLEAENSALKDTVFQFETENSALKATVFQFEADTEQLRLQARDLEQCNKKMTKRLEQIPKDLQLSPPTLNEVVRPFCTLNCDVDSKIEDNKMKLGINSSLQFSAHEKKTTQIIRRLEQNLKKEGQAKQAMTAHLKTKSSLDMDEKQINAMKEEIATLKIKLEAEKDHTTTLRREISELRPREVSSILRKQSSQLDSNPGTPVRMKPKHSSENSNSDVHARTPVRGLVESFEKKKVSNHAKRPGEGAAMFGVDNIEELKDALHFERQQVFELEDELTRQCEINCALLKEIASLTQDNESSRSRHATAFHGGNTTDKRKIEMLSTEVSQLKLALETAEQEKAQLSKQLDIISASHKAEVDGLNSKLEVIKNQLTKAEGICSSMTRLQSASAVDRTEIDRLKLQARELESQLSESRQKLQKLQIDITSSKSEIERLQQKIADLEDERQSRRRQFEEQELRMSQLEVEVERLQDEGARAVELEAELSKLEVLKSDYSARGDEIAGLKSLVEGLEASLGDSHLTAESLQNQKETSRQLESLVQQLKEEMDVAETKIASLASELADTKQSEQEIVASLTAQIESLTIDLNHVSEQRDKMELNCRVHHNEKIESMTSQVNSLSNQLQSITEERDQVQEQNRVNDTKFDSLRVEIDLKVHEFEKIHMADKEEISRLHIQVHSLETELHNTLTTVIDLKNSLKEKEQVEETVESLQRQNQEAFDAQINKLQKELTTTRLAETETKKKIQSLEESIASMQEDSSITLAAKDMAIEAMRNTLSDKEGAIDRLMKEKEQLVLSMKDMTSSRRDEIDELQGELMEMSTRAANQAREVQNLKVQLEDSEYRKEEMDRLRKRVRELSQQLATRSPSNTDGEKTSELQMENSELRQRLRDANLAIKAAEGKMRELAAEKGSSKSMQVLRDRNASLKFEVEKLTRKLQKLAERKQMPESHRSSDATRQVRLTKEQNTLGSKEGNSMEGTRFMI